MEKIILYTDGGCSPNPGNGGWGCIAVFDDYDIYLSGNQVSTTNNIMEMTGVIEGLKHFSQYKIFDIYSDSTYVINCAKGKWKRNKNIELWNIFDRVSKNKTINWFWVKGHSGDKYNEMVDKLVKEEIKILKKSCQE
jgi:ribonuclease HI